MEKSKIEINEDELTTILFCVSQRKVGIELKIEGHQKGLDSGYYAKNYNAGYEDKVKGYIEKYQKQIDELNILHNDLVEKYVKGIEK